MARLRKTSSLVRVSTEFELELKKMQKSFQDRYGKKPSFTDITKDLKLNMECPDVKLKLRKYKNMFGEE